MFQIDYIEAISNAINDNNASYISNYYVFCRAQNTLRTNTNTPHFVFVLQNRKSFKTLNKRCTRIERSNKRKVNQRLDERCL